MICKTQEGVITLDAKNYQLTLAVPPEPSFLLAKSSGRLFGFVAGGDCALYKQQWDDSCDVTAWQVKESGTCVEFRRCERSNSWKSKTFVICAEEDSLTFHHELEGEGDLDEVRFFRACYSGNEFGFAGDFDEIYSAAPNFREQLWYHPSARVIITNGDDLSMCSGATALANVPDIMGLHDRRDTALLGAAIFAKPGEYLWDDMVWNPQVKKAPTDYEGDQSMAGGFAIRYCGKKHVSGKWNSPCFVFTFPKNADDTIPCSLEYAYKKSLLPRPNPKHDCPDWWKEPIYCTWHDQTSLSDREQIDYRTPRAGAGTFCTQELTEKWLQLLIDHNAKPGIVILDDKWQKSKFNSIPDTEKWPDMRGWIDSCHDRGVKVMLWGLAWHNEDIPVEEAITRDGKVVCGDITNPKYEERIRRQVHYHFSDEPGCLNADGVKIDGMMNLPVGEGLKSCKAIWGLELQRYLLKIVYEEAKKAKKDVIISTFAANPYLDEFTDMVRLADMYCYRLSTANSMRWRQFVFHCTNPGVLVDTDGQMNFHIGPDYRDILDVEKELGIPTLYNAEYIRRSRFFFTNDFRKLNEGDYAKFAEIFAQYRKGLK